MAQQRLGTNQPQLSTMTTPTQAKVGISKPETTVEQTKLGMEKTVKPAQKTTTGQTKLGMEKGKARTTSKATQGKISKVQPAVQSQLSQLIDEGLKELKDDDPRVVEQTKDYQKQIETYKDLLSEVERELGSKTDETSQKKLAYEKGQYQSKIKEAEDAIQSIKQNIVYQDLIDSGKYVEPEPQYFEKGKSVDLNLYQKGYMLADDDPRVSEDVKPYKDKIEKLQEQLSQIEVQLKGAKDDQLIKNLTSQKDSVNKQIKDNKNTINIIKGNVAYNELVESGQYKEPEPKYYDIGQPWDAELEKQGYTLRDDDPRVTDEIKGYKKIIEDKQSELSKTDNELLKSIALDWAWREGLSGGITQFKSEDEFAQHLRTLPGFESYLYGRVGGGLSEMGAPVGNLLEKYRESLKYQMKDYQDKINKIKGDILSEERQKNVGKTVEEEVQQRWDESGNAHKSGQIKVPKHYPIKKIEEHPAYGWVDVAIHANDPATWYAPVMSWDAREPEKIEGTVLQRATQNLNTYTSALDVVEDYIKSHPLTQEKWGSMSEVEKLDWLNGLEIPRFQAQVGRGKVGPGSSGSSGGAGEVTEFGQIRGATGLASLSPAAQQAAAIVGYGGLSGDDVKAVLDVRQSDPSLSGQALASAVYKAGYTGTAAKLGSVEAQAQIDAMRAEAQTKLGQKKQSIEDEKENKDAILYKGGTDKERENNVQVTDLVIEGKVFDESGKPMTMARIVNEGYVNPATGVATDKGEHLGYTESGQEVGLQGKVFGPVVGDMANVAAPGIVMTIHNPDGSESYVFREPATQERPLGYLTVWDGTVKGTSLNTITWDMDKPDYATNYNKASDYQKQYGNEATWDAIKESVDEAGYAKPDNKLGLSGHVLNSPMGDYIAPSTGLKSWGEYVNQHPELGLQYQPLNLETASLPDPESIRRKYNELEKAKPEELSEIDKQFINLVKKHKDASGEIDFQGVYKDYVPNILEPSMRAAAQSIIQRQELLSNIKLTDESAQKILDYVKAKKDKGEQLTAEEDNIMLIYEQHLSNNKGVFNPMGFRIALEREIKSDLEAYQPVMMAAISITTPIQGEQKTAETKIKPIVESIQEKFMGVNKLTEWEQYVLEQKARFTNVDKVNWAGLEKELQSTIDKVSAGKLLLQGTPSTLTFAKELPISNGLVFKASQVFDQNRDKILYTNDDLTAIGLISDGLKYNVERINRDGKYLWQVCAGGMCFGTNAKDTLEQAIQSIHKGDFKPSREDDSNYSQTEFYEPFIKEYNMQPIDNIIWSGDEKSEILKVESKPVSVDVIPIKTAGINVDLFKAGALEYKPQESSMKWGKSEDVGGPEGAGEGVYFKGKGEVDYGGAVGKKEVDVEYFVVRNSDGSVGGLYWKEPGMGWRAGDYKYMPNTKEVMTIQCMGKACQLHEDDLRAGVNYIIGKNWDIPSVSKEVTPSGVPSETKPTESKLPSEKPSIPTENLPKLVKPTDENQFKQWKDKFELGKQLGVFGDIKDAIFAGIDELGNMKYVPKDIYDSFTPKVKDIFDKSGMVGAEEYVNNVIKGLEQYKTPEGDYDLYRYAKESRDNGKPWSEIADSLRVFAGDDKDTQGYINEVLTWIPNDKYLSDKEYNSLPEEERVKYNKEHLDDPRVIFSPTDLPMAIFTGEFYYNTWEEGVKNQKYKGQPPSPESVAQSISSVVSGWNKSASEVYDNWRKGLQSIPASNVITTLLPQDRKLPQMFVFGGAEEVKSPLVSSKQFAEIRNKVEKAGMTEEWIQDYTNQNKESQIKGFMLTGLSREEAEKRVESGFGTEAMLHAVLTLQELGKMIPIIPLYVAEDLSKLDEGDRTAIIDAAEQVGALTVFAIPNMAGSVADKIVEGKPGAAIGETAGYGIGIVVGPHNVVRLIGKGGEKVIQTPKTLSERTLLNTIEIPMSGVPPKVGVGKMLAVLQNAETIFKDGDFTRDRVLYDSTGKLVSRVTPLARAGISDHFHVTNRFEEYADKIASEGNIPDLSEIAARGSIFPGQGAYFSPNASVRLSAAIEPVGNVTGLIGKQFKFKQVPKEVQDIYNELSMIDESKVSFDLVNDVVDRAVEKYLEMENKGLLEPGSYPVFKTWARPNVEKVINYLRGKGIDLGINPKEQIPPEKMSKLMDEYNKISPDKRLDFNEWVLELESYRTKNAPLYPTIPTWDTKIKELGDTCGGSYMRVNEDIKDMNGKVVIKKGGKAPIMWLADEPNQVPPSLTQRMEAEWIFEPLSQFRRLFRPTKTKLGFGYGNIRLGDIEGLEISHYNNPNDYFALPRRGTSVIRNSQNPKQILLGKSNDELHFDTIGGSNFKFGTNVLESGEAPIEVSLVRETIDEAGVIPMGGKYVGQMLGRHMDTKLLNGDYKEGLRVFDIYEVDYKGQPKPSSEVEQLAWYDGKNLYDMNGKKIEGKVSDMTPKLYDYVNNSNIKVETKITEPQRALESKKPVAIRWDADKQHNVIVPKDEVTQVILIDESNNPVRTLNVVRQEGQTIKDAIKSELDKQGIESMEYSYISTEYKFPNNEWSENVPGTILDTYAVKIKPKGNEYSVVEQRPLELFQNTLGTRTWKQFNPILTDNKAYISVDLADKAKLQIGKIQSKLKEESTKNNWGNINWQSPDKFHITLRYIGKMPNEDLAKLDKAIEKINDYVKSKNIKLEVSGWEAWPNAKDPRILSLRLKDVDNMGKAYTLQRIVDAATTEAGLSPATYKFEPHITLAEIPRDLPIEKKMEIAGYIVKNRNKDVIPIDEYNIKVKQSSLDDVIAPDIELEVATPTVLRDVNSTGSKEAEIGGAIKNVNPDVPDNIVKGIAAEEEFKTYHGDVYQKMTGKEISPEELERAWLYYKETQPLAVKGELTNEKAYQILKDIDTQISLKTKDEVPISGQVSKLGEVPTVDTFKKVMEGRATEQEYKDYFAKEYKQATGKEIPQEQLDRDWKQYQENVKPMQLGQKIIEMKATPQEIIEFAQKYNIPEDKVKLEFQRHGYVYGGLRAQYPAPENVQRVLAEGVRRYNRISEDILDKFDSVRQSGDKAEITRLINELDTKYGVMIHEGKYGDIPLPGELSDPSIPKYLAESKGELWAFEGKKLQNKLESLKLNDIYRDAQRYGSEKVKGLADEIDFANIKDEYAKGTLQEIVHELYGGELGKSQLSKLIKEYQKYSNDIAKDSTKRFSNKKTEIDIKLDELVEKSKNNELTDTEVAEWLKDSYPEYNRGFALPEGQLPAYVESFKNWMKDVTGKENKEAVNEIHSRLSEYNDKLRSIKFNEYYGEKLKANEVKLGTPPYIETSKYESKEYKYKPSYIADYVKTAGKYPTVGYPTQPVYPVEISYAPSPTYPFVSGYGSTPVYSYQFTYPYQSMYPPSPTYPPVPPAPPVPPVPAKPPIPLQKKRTWESLTPEEKAASIVWKQGFAYWCVPPPWRDEDKIYSSRPFPGTKIHSGPKSAYKSVAMVKGEELPEKIQINLGTQDLEFIKDKDGKDVVVRYKLDPNYVGARRGYTKEKVKGRKSKEVELSTVGG